MKFTGTDQVFSRMSRLMNRLDNPELPLKDAGEYLRESVDTNFEVSGRPRRWRALAASTLRARRRRGNSSDKILVDTGAMREGIETVMHGDSVEVGSNAVQARRLHWGYPGGAGRGHSKTPARPFVLIQSWDVDAAGEIFSRHYRS